MLSYFSKDFSVSRALGAFTADPLSEVIAADAETGKGGLFISNWQPPSQVATLQKHKINFVLSALDITQPNAQYPALGITQKLLPAKDVSEFDLSQFFDEAYEFIRNGLQQGNVLVHCAAGVSRSASLLLVYLMRTRNEGFEAALTFLRSKRSICTPNKGFEQQLRDYAKKHGLPE